jgi:beta-lactamase class D
MKTAMRFGLMTLGMLMLLTSPGHAEDTGCTLIVDFKSSEIIYEDGDCNKRFGAQSTFKIPLAIMGFDSGILKNENTPSWPYKKSYDATRSEEREATTPTRWEKESVVWFSQKLTRQMGLDKFRNYVNRFNYGNMDITGDAGKNNGLTNAWLSSSLKISPIEQVGFIRKLLRHELHASKHAHMMTISIIPTFNAGEWIVHGKTGSGFKRHENGALNRDMQEGWFVGWAERDNRKVIFAKFVEDKIKTDGYAGPRARDALLKALPAMIRKDEFNKH